MSTKFHTTPQYQTTASTHISGRLSRTERMCSRTSSNFFPFRSLVWKFRMGRKLTHVNRNQPNSLTVRSEHTGFTKPLRSFAAPFNAAKPRVHCKSSGKPSADCITRHFDFQGQDHWEEGCWPLRSTFCYNTPK